MAWPPTIPPNTRTNATITLDNHPDDHNQTSDALTETVTEVNLKAPKANPIFTGVITLPAGTAAAPALTWTGDTNTGLYSDSADTVRVSTGGLMRASFASTPNLTLTAVAATDVPLVAKGAAAQSASLQQWQDSTGTVLASVSNGGSIQAPYFQDPTFTGPYVEMGTTKVSVINRTTTTNVPLIVKGMAAQSGALQQWQNSSGTTLASVSAAGLGTFAGVTSTGVVTVAAGTAAAPALTWTGDTNTGLYSDTADTIRFSTGGTLRATINSTGLAVGSNAPSAQAHVYGAGQATAALTDAGATGATLFLQSSDAGAGSGGAILVGCGSQRWAAIKGLYVDGTGNGLGSLAFSSRAATGDTALTERMRLNYLGNLGVGVDPGNTGRLYVRGSDAATAVAVVKGAGSQSANLQLWLDSAGSTLAYVSPAGLGVFAGIAITDASNLTVGTTTGTKIGIATTQKLGFWNATPVVQPTNVANPTGGATVDAEARTAIDAILSRLETIGLFAA